MLTNHHRPMPLQTPERQSSISKQSSLSHLFTLVSHLMLIFRFGYVSYYCHIPLLFRPHMGYVKALQEAYNANVVFTKRGQKNDLGLMFGVSGSKWHCVPFSFRLELEVCGDLVADDFINFN